MAKWGEGDPRWIVEERPDAINVNNWHWTEKEATKWSEDKIRELLTGFNMDSDVASVTITEIDKMEGEASVNNRKAKLIYLYDWNICLKWKGRLKGGTEECEGKFNIPNLSDENDLDEVDIEVSLKESTREGEIVKEFLFHDGKERIREKLGTYLKLLKEEFSKGVILPKKDGSDKNNPSDKEKHTNFKDGIHTKVNLLNDARTSCQNDKSKTSFTTLNASYNFQCMGDEFYNCLTDQNMLQAFTRGPVVVEAKPGGKFELFGGNITGTFVELIPGKKIVKNWRLKSWPAGHHSTVTLTIDQQESDTLVKLSQTSIPSSELDVMRKNWESYYWDSIKRTFGWGCFL